MVRIFVTIALIFTSSISFGASKDALKKKIHELCMSRFARTLDTRKAVCDCSVKNLDLKNDEKELEFIYQFLKNKKAPEKLNDEQTMLVEYSTDVSEKCVKDPTWVVNQ